LTANRAIFDICVGSEHVIEVVEAFLVDRGGVRHEQLLDFQPVGDLFQAQHVVD